jgi:hypothetical protein
MTRIEPCGVTLQIEHEGKTYYGHMYNNYERFKTFGNYDLNPYDDLVLFDDNWKLIPYTDDLYEILADEIQKQVIEEKDPDE